jgi:hypothetical protein
MSEPIQFAGHIDVENITLIGLVSGANNSARALDLSSVLKIEIFESIFYPFTTAKIFIEDSIDLLNTIPIRGEEILNITASTPSITNNKNKLDFAFHIYKVTDKFQSADRRSSYMLHGISAEAFINANVRSSRAFNGKISEIVEDIMTNSKYGLSAKKDRIIQPTSNSIKYISNYWTPLENLEYLKNNAVSEDGSPAYTLFENRDGFNFISIEKMYSGQEIQTFIKDNNANGSKDNTHQKYNRIINIESVNLFDYYQNNIEGVFGSHQSTYNITLKKHKSNEYIFSQDTSRIRLNKYDPFTSSLSQSAMNIKTNGIKHYGLFDDVVGGAHLDADQKRMARLNCANYNTIKIEVAGRTDYTVGYPVYVKVPRDTMIDQNSDDTSILDPLLSGKYIIAEINHLVTLPSKHRAIMTLIKESTI